jgi:hypothetical protein
MNQPTIFVTYNAGNDFEQTLAVRLHTIGSVHGFNMFMPDRFYGSKTLDLETAHRIKNSDYFILFSTSPLTQIVQEEINTAFAHLKDKSKILIIYNKVKNLVHGENCTEVFIDARSDSPQQILDKIIEQIRINQSKSITTKKAKETDMMATIGGILLIGLGLLTLDAILDPKKK